MASDAYAEGLRLLAGRELSVARLRTRLRDRGHRPEDVDGALARLLESGALDDRRTALAHARVAATAKGRGRLRVLRELHDLGIPRGIASAAVAEVFAELDERALVERAIRKKLRGRSRPSTPPERARLYQFLMRQGFTPATVAALLRDGGDDEDSIE